MPRRAGAEVSPAGVAGPTQPGNETMPEGNPLLRTPLHALHVQAGARMIDQAGWDMPSAYRDVQTECREVRSRAGVFDVSHVARIRVRGAGAVDLLERLCTADVARQEDNTARYSLLLNEGGGISADALVVRLESFWVLTVSPPFRQDVLSRATALAGELGAKVDDQTAKTAMVAVAGPGAARILDAVLPEKPSLLAPGAARTGSLVVAKYVAMRTGCTGQWSLEVMLPNMLASQAWRFITAKAGANCIVPAGLAARDVLRIEAGVPLCGQDLTPDVDVVSAGLMGAVDLDHEFIGRDAVRRVLDAGPARRRVGLQGEGAEASVPPCGSQVLDRGGREIGTVTSAAYSSTLEQVIAMAYVSPEAAEIGTDVTLAHASGRLAATVSPMPFAPPMLA